jgi:hypothetical protein
MTKLYETHTRWPRGLAGDGSYVRANQRHESREVLHDALCKEKELE